MMLTERQALLPSTELSSIHSSPLSSLELLALAGSQSRDIMHSFEGIKQQEPSHGSECEMMSPIPEAEQLSSAVKPSRKLLQDLPEEIQQSILDIMVGTLRSTSSSHTDRKFQGMRNWSTAMRHPRGRHLADLALVSPAWRRMVQERLYRHIKVKGTKGGLEECADWFLTQSHLQQYVRHIEIWVPVWERREGYQRSAELSGALTFERSTQPHGVITVVGSQETENINAAYQLSTQNSTLDEIFSCVDCLFPTACVLTVEGGHCKKPPKIQHFRHTPRFVLQELAPLPNIRTLILKGAWNVMRECSDFQVITSALKNLREMHVNYAKPKARAYLIICEALRHFPSTITHLNICLEPFYCKEAPSAPKMRLYHIERHFCKNLGSIVPQLEALTYTGKVCGLMLASAMENSERARKSTLKSIDLVVKNCCREVSKDLYSSNEGTGINNGSFVRAFEALVVSCVRALRAFLKLDFLRIRFVDLDSPCPLLNPYFQLRNNQCTGIWNDEILSILGQARPLAVFADLKDSMMKRQLDKNGRPIVGWPMQRPKSINVKSYQVFTNL